MATMPPVRTMRIAILNADKPVPNVYSKFGTYGAIFDRLLKEASGRVAPHLEIRSEEFDAVKGEYPPRPEDFDAFLITGAAAAAYDKDEWILKLNEFARRVYRDHPSSKWFGSCFGHQLLGDALLVDAGAIVEKDPNGLEVGVHSIQLTPEFREALGGGKSVAKASQLQSPPDSPPPAAAPEYENAAKPFLRLQMVHGDHVRFPDGRPPSGWIAMGSTAHCAVQGLYKPGRVLTYQGHFEFDRFINRETVSVLVAKWDPQVLQSSLKQVDADDDDAADAADMVVRFLLEDLGAIDGDRHLSTPPMTD